MRKKMMLLILAIITTTTIVACNSDETIKNTDIPETQDSTGENGKPMSFIPENWEVIIKDEEAQIVKGDLNYDGLDDVAVLIERIGSEDEIKPRVLIIAVGKSDGTFELDANGKNVLLNADEGGVWGDPLEGISIENDTLKVDFYGGSNYRWYSTYRFSYQEEDWYLTGVTQGSYFTGNTTIDEADETEIDLITGDYIEKIHGEDGKMITNKGNRGVADLVRLEDFDIRSEINQY